MNETFIPRSRSAALIALRFASRTSTGSVRNEVAVGMPEIAIASSIVSGLRILSSRVGALVRAVAVGGREDILLTTLPPGLALQGADVKSLRGDAAGDGEARPLSVD